LTRSGFDSGEFVLGVLCSIGDSQAFNFSSGAYVCQLSSFDLSIEHNFDSGCFSRLKLGCYENTVVICFKVTVDELRGGL